MESEVSEWLGSKCIEGRGLVGYVGSLDEDCSVYMLVKVWPGAIAMLYYHQGMQQSSRLSIGVTMWHFELLTKDASSCLPAFAQRNSMF